MMLLKINRTLILALFFSAQSLIGADPVQEPESSKNAPGAAKTEKKAVKANDKVESKAAAKKKAKEEKTIEEDGAVEQNLAGAMNNKRLNKLIKKLDPKAEGGEGAWKFVIDEVEYMCFTDEAADRMRIMAAVAPLNEVTEEQMAECMKANFDRALDARYCVNHGVLWTAFIHPLKCLTTDLFKSGVFQVGTARETFGTEYTSGGLLFGGGEKSKELEEENGGNGAEGPVI